MALSSLPFSHVPLGTGSLWCTTQERCPKSPKQSIETCEMVSWHHFSHPCFLELHKLIQYCATLWAPAPALNWSARGTGWKLILYCVCNISLLSQTNYQLLFHFMDKIRNLFFNLVSTIALFSFFWVGLGDVFFCSIKDFNLIFCSELLSNECKVLDLETGRLANGFVSLLSSMPHSLLLSVLWLTWFAGQIHRREDDVLTYINARMPVM